MKNYLDKGGNILVLLGEGGETRFGTNINFLLEDFGIMVNNGKKLYFCLEACFSRKFRMGGYHFS